MTPRLATGRIVWAHIADANGIRKLRPAIIVTPTDRLATDKPIDVVAVTSRLVGPLPDDHVLLPWHRNGHPRTGLNRRCAAVATWLAQIVEGDIEDTAGIVPSSIMTEILAKIGAVAPAARPGPARATPKDAPTKMGTQDTEASA
jgi:mRNA-degrading endonuclease toxin of MazEF toxin-antitoxin module